MGPDLGDAAMPLRLSGEDLTFWWADSPMQPTTMAMLLLLDRMPEWDRVRRAVGRAIGAVPRLRQRVVDAPLDLTLPHWAPDPTFDLDYHLRRHALGGTKDLEELFREIAPAYETPFDRSRPLWEARVYEGLADGGAAMFFSAPDDHGACHRTLAPRARHGPRARADDARAREPPAAGGVVDGTPTTGNPEVVRANAPA